MLQGSHKTHLQVPLDITEEGYVAYSCDSEQEKGAGEYDDSKEGRDCETGCDQVILRKILLEVIPRGVIPSRQIDGIEGQGIDDLTGAIGEKQTLPTYSRA